MADFNKSTHNNNWLFPTVAALDDQYKENMKQFYDSVKQMAEYTHQNRS